MILSGYPAEVKVDVIHPARQAVAEVSDVGKKVKKSTSKYLPVIALILVSFVFVLVIAEHNRENREPIPVDEVTKQ